MNTSPKKVLVIQCLKCPRSFMKVGSTAIGLAFPRPISRVLNEKTGETMNAEGVCPIHRRSLSDQISISD